MKLNVPNDTISQDLARYLFENQRTKFSHLTDLWPCPPHMKDEPDSRELLKKNPFRLMKKRPSALTSEVPRLYSAVAFAMWQYGLVMNVHLTVCWRLLRVSRHAKAAEILSRYNHEAAKWLRVGVDDNLGRRRLSRRASGMSSDHVFVYVHEHARDQGLHTHELLSLPVSKAQAFADWTRFCLARLSGCSTVDEAAVFFSPASAKRRQFKPYEGKLESFAVDRQWKWFRYISKSLHPDHTIRSADTGVVRGARDIFQISNPFVETSPVECTKLAGYSENISPAAQRRAGFKSKFEAGDWAKLYDGSELDEYRDHTAVLLKQSRAMAEEEEMKAMLDRMII